MGAVGPHKPVARLVVNWLGDGIRYTPLHCSVTGRRLSRRSCPCSPCGQLRNSDQLRRPRSRLIDPVQPAGDREAAAAPTPSPGTRSTALDKR